MKIPEPARRGWTDVLECVDEVFRTREGGRGWSLHGGTLLAMRWDGHRESTDIDLLIGADAVTTLWEMVDGPKLAGLDDRLGCRGWTLLADRRNAWSRVYGHETGEGRIDLLQNEPRPTTGRRLERVEGEEIWCLSTAQVLAGKLIGRGPAAPVRDLYDVAVAARRTPQALARALDEVETPRLAAMLKGWLGAAHAYAARARVEIRGARDEDIEARPAEEAVIACARCWTRTYRAWRDEDGWRIMAPEPGRAPRAVWREGEGDPPQGPAGRTLAAAKAKGEEVTASDLPGGRVMEGMERAASARMEGAGHRAEGRKREDG